MIKLTVGNTTLLISPIEIVDGMTRRQCERAVVADMLRCHFGEDVEVKHDSEGAPHLESCNISVSHSRRLAVVALDDQNKVGVDAEEWREALHRVKDRFLSVEEMNRFTTPRELLAAWTIKEAVYKVVGREATEFSTAISINSTMTQAECSGHIYDVWATDIEDTHISLVKQRDRSFCFKSGVKQRDMKQRDRSFCFKSGV